MSRGTYKIPEIELLNLQITEFDISLWNLLSLYYDLSLSRMLSTQIRESYILETRIQML